MKELKELVKKAHEACENKEGFLSKITLEEVKKINDISVEKCNFCPFNTNCKICDGTEEIIFNGCYECNKCGKWSFDEEEIRQAINRRIQEELGY